MPWSAATRPRIDVHPSADAAVNGARASRDIPPARDECTGEPLAGGGSGAAPVRRGATSRTLAPWTDPHTYALLHRRQHRPVRPLMAAYASLGGLTTHQRSSRWLLPKSTSFARVFARHHVSVRIGGCRRLCGSLRAGMERRTSLCSSPYRPRRVPESHQGPKCRRRANGAKSSRCVRRRRGSRLVHPAPLRRSTLCSPGHRQQAAAGGGRACRRASYTEVPTEEYWRREVLPARGLDGGREGRRW
jgi:hypothetical protein